MFQYICLLEKPLLSLWLEMVMNLIMKVVLSFSKNKYMWVYCDWRINSHSIARLYSSSNTQWYISWIITYVGLVGSKCTLSINSKLHSSLKTSSQTLPCVENPQRQKAPPAWLWDYCCLAQWLLLCTPPAYTLSNTTGFGVWIPVSWGCTTAVTEPSWECTAVVTEPSWGVCSSSHRANPTFPGLFICHLFAFFFIRPHQTNH